MGWKNIEDRRKYGREYMAAKRKWLKEHHRCIECKQQDARTLIGRPTCFDCFVKINGHEPIIREKKKRVWLPKHSIPKSEYVANGLCAICGVAPIIPGKKVCQRHYDIMLEVAWKGRKAQGPRDIRYPSVNTEKARAAYRYCIEHRQEYLERWAAEYGCDRYEDRASGKEQRSRA